MGKLIDVDHFKKTLGNLTVSDGDRASRELVANTLGKVVPQLLEAEPAVDAVPVVRCGECIHACESVGNKFSLACYIHGFNVKSDDYCSYAERKEERK